MSTGLRKVKTYKESKPVTKVGRTIKGGGGEGEVVNNLMPRF